MLYLVHLQTAERLRATLLEADIDVDALIASGQLVLIALTGYGLASDRARALAAGFDEHVVKPVSPERLEQLIAQLTSLSAG